MSEAINLKMSKDALLAAGKLIEGPFSPLSPFQFGSDETGAEAPANLVSAGKLRNEYNAAFQSLAKTARIGAAAYLSGNDLMDASFYYPADGGVIVSLVLDDDGIRLQSPANPAALLSWLAERIGTSVLRKTAMDVNLTYDEARTFFAVLDAARRSTFAGMSGKGEGGSGQVSKTSVIEALLEENENMQWLAPHFAESYQMAALSALEAEQLLMRLAQKGFVMLKGDQVGLSEMLAALAENFLQVNGHLRLRNAELEKNGRIATTELRAVQGQGNAMMVWSDDGKGIHLISASPAQLMVIAQDILGPGEEMTLASEPVPVQKTPAKKDKKAARRDARAGGKKKRRWWLIPIILVALFLLIFLIMLMTA